MPWLYYPPYTPLPEFSPVFCWLGLIFQCLLMSLLVGLGSILLFSHYILKNLYEYSDCLWSFQWVHVCIQWVPKTFWSAGTAGNNAFIPLNFRSSFCVLNLSTYHPLSSNIFLEGKHRNKIDFVKKKKKNEEFPLKWCRHGLKVVGKAHLVLRKGKHDILNVEWVKINE